jgi:hypothetical protein
MQNKWTVVYLIDTMSDPGLTPALQQMFNNLFSLTIGQDVSMVFCLNATEDVIRAIETGTQPAGPDTSNMTAAFYSLQPTGQTKNGRKSDLKSLGIDPAFDMHESDAVENFFIKYVFPEYSADQYMLFTWGHGAGYGLFVDHPGKPSNIDERRPAQWDMLSAKDLSDAITGAFSHRKDEKVNLVVTMSCYMQLLDTGLELARAGVEYFVAPENLEMATGYNYPVLFGKLFSDPEIKPEALARLVVTSLEKRPFLNSAADPLAQTCIFTNDLHGYINFAQAVSDLAVLLKGRLKDHFTDIRNAIRECWIYGGTALLLSDFFRFAENIGALFSGEPEDQQVRKIMELKDKIVLEQHYGSWQTAQAPNDHPLGISVCLPHTGKQSNTSFYITYIKKGSPYATSFSADYQWSDFLDEFVTMDLQGPAQGEPVNLIYELPEGAHATGHFSA